MAKRRRSVFSFASWGCFGGQAREKRAEDEYQVKLHIYDLSQGVARQLSTTIPGKAIQAIWHTGVVVYGKEYYFGKGIQLDQPGKTPYGAPVRIEDFGVTLVSKEVFEGFLQDISQCYTPATYNLLSNNCNNFSNEVVQFLVGSTIPSYILDMPSKAMKTPIGALMLPMIHGLETTLRGGAAPQPPQFKPAPATTMQKQPSLNSIQVQPRSFSTNKSSTDKTIDDGSRIIPPMVQPVPAGATQAKPSSDSIQVQSRSISIDEMSTYKTADNCSRIIPPTVQPASAAATQTQPSSNSIHTQPRSIGANKTCVDKTTNDDSRITPSTVQPVPEAATQTQASSKIIHNQPRTIDADKTCVDKRTNDGIITSPVVQPAAPTAAQVSTNATATQGSTKAAASLDPLREAKNQVQEEIKREFTAIMATGTVQASEAAVLAMRRVIERYGVQLKRR